ncbi:nucleotidyltransferase family protein [Methanococcus aeolicus]|uniref:Putative cytidyltransferase-related C-terminal region domain-containing protein n=1 Tax=Methanococcus aeolicus (strain ATCC BAA-1280 / DSM 17508 / OCM 812 / Nankai-3) TaxID=419665 RepID=A6UVK8_META3|nr:nucleotidyltransferase family protein [Methanococcus aeolicus]ABR56530.1 protein of unknown function DUF795 [Methanococcus aeolicus Nankai-3]UXM84535.1 nucleotidyltransferase family protein [Methanococcus aeolicus]
MGDIQLINFLKDRKDIIHNSNLNSEDGANIDKFKKIVDKIKDENSELRKPTKIVADFTEYNPLHNGHKYCLKRGKEQGIFISVLPAPLERSGRGIPYFVNRYIRAEMAIEAGADIVVEGPPMGIMGSGQYMQCIIKAFQTIGAEIIPRGYIPEKTMDKVINCINAKNHIKVKPYKIKCMETGELLGEKLEIDNYVIASMSNTIYKLNNKWNSKNNSNIKFNPKFLFIERIEGISGTKIRENIFNGNFKDIGDMLPETTINILKKYNIQDIILKRFEDRILETVNEYELNKYVPEKLANLLEQYRPFNTIDEIKEKLPYGFSKHYKERIISKLEARIEEDIISKYIMNYPSKINILGIRKNP